MHPEVKVFCLFVKSIFPEYFENKNILDVGSGDINGNNHYLFNNCKYNGNDVVKNKNVTIVSRTKDLPFPSNTFDTIISTECFEHDPEYAQSLKKIYDMLKENGLFVFTCASTGRGEHGTRRTCSWASLASGNKIEDMQDYYKNLDEIDLNDVLNLNILFSQWDTYYGLVKKDLYFVGIKKARREKNKNIINNLPKIHDKSVLLTSNNIKSKEIRLQELQSELNFVTIPNYTGQEPIGLNGYWHFLYGFVIDLFNKLNSKHRTSHFTIRFWTTNVKHKNNYLNVKLHNLLIKKVKKIEYIDINSNTDCIKFYKGMLQYSKTLKGGEPSFAKEFSFKESLISKQMIVLQRYDICGLFWCGVNSKGEFGNCGWQKETDKILKKGNKFLINAKDFAFKLLDLKLNKEPTDIILIDREEYKITDPNINKCNLHRRGASSKRITNMKNIKTLLLKYNKNLSIKSVFLENASFKEQIEIFSNAMMVIGLHGSGFANIVWCPLNCKIIEIKLEPKFNEIFTIPTISKLLHRYKYSRCLKNEKQTSFPTCPVDINKLEQDIQDELLSL